jgi:putative transposase
LNCVRRLPSPAHVQPSPFRCFKTSPEVIRLAVMPYIRFQLSLRNVADFLHERGVEIQEETLCYC